jgi:flavin-dependent dehydrogenase
MVVGASFAGLASALALSRAGLRVTVLEKKTDVGTKLHTTGIIVKDAVDQVALLDTLPTSLVRRIPGVRLYAPNLHYVDLEAPGYCFLATDTPAVMRWLASEAERAGSTIAYGTVFTGARRLQSGFEVDGFGTTRFLIGADGPRARASRARSNSARA